MSGQIPGQHTRMNRSSAKRSHSRVIAAALGACFVLMLTVIVSRGISATLQSEQTSTLHSHLTTETTTEKATVNKMTAQSTTKKVLKENANKMTTPSTTEKATLKKMTTQSTTKKVYVKWTKKMMTTRSATQKESVNKMTTQSTTEKASVNKMTAQSTTNKVLKENANKMTTPSTTKKANVMTTTTKSATEKATLKKMTTQSTTKKGYSCPVGWLRAGSKCYYELHDRRSSQENESYCQGRGGSLIVVNSREKQRILHGETTEEVQQCGLQ
ncbi:integumentary mucin A.1-like isoform X2 [Astatotilapia calliptera]|uniref:integumentary mucin A.1-like isoform X2 n=1 Tax=Astatotilapia calliptera TaxID=8154 RepID=UPI000E41B656|nr:integumentary mucin A.1-like isoform X2 [Astatotilapia calliptera]